MSAHHTALWPLDNSRPPRPHPSEPGTFSQQLQAVGLFLNDSSRLIDREDAWQRARALVMPHARRGYLRAREVA